MLSTDVESYLREYYYIRSLYGSVLEFCRESTDYILREELQEFIEFFTRLIPIATILTSQFLHFYHIHVLHSFFFFLSSEKSYITISNLVLSTEMRQFISLTSSYNEYIKPCVSSLSSSAYYNEGRSEMGCVLPDNWFTTETAFMIYSQVSICFTLKSSLFN